MKNSKKTPNFKTKKFICEACSFGCNNKNDFNRHNSTTKHFRLTQASCTLTQKTPTQFHCEFCNKFFKHRQSLYRHKKICKNASVCYPKVIQNYPSVIHDRHVCECGKSYKYASGLSKHKMKCTYLQDEEPDNNNTEIIPTNNVEKLLKNIMLDNKAILEENKILREKISNLEVGNTYNNQTNNNQFNINMFLNEKCKNAMNLEDFVEKIKLTLEDLKYTSENGYAKGISNIFIKNLNDMDVTERPIHCSDQKRLKFYIKNDNEWTRDKNNEKIDNSIEKISKKQLQTIKDWIKENPNYLDSEVKTDEYFTLVKSITQPNDNKNLKDIKRQVGENVKIDK